MIPDNTILLKDCIAGMQELPDACIDVIVTSPPYNLGIRYSAYNDSRPREEYLAWIADAARECKRVLSEDGSFYLNVGGSLNDPWIPMDIAQKFRSEGFILQNTIHWIKSIAIPKEDMGKYKAPSDIAVGHYKPIKSRRYHNDCHEFIFHFTKTGSVEIDRLGTGVPYQDKSNIGRWGTVSRDLRDRGNVWFIPYETIVTHRPHPASFPVQLPVMCIKDHGLSRCRRVMDPFMGIGNTAIAALRLGIPYIGFEIDESYYQTACERLTEEQQTTV